MKHKLFLVLAALGLLLPQVASAYDFEVDGIYYNILGSDAEVAWGSPKYSGSVVIPSTVTYSDKTYSVTRIGVRAFEECSGLTSITIPNSVKSIGKEAFHYCISLASVTIPNSVTSMEDNVFTSCLGLTSITVASDNTTYDSRDNCNAIIETSTNTLIAGCQNSTIPNSVTNIGKSAFYCCRDLTSITIPSSVTCIESFAFRGCSSLKSITIPNNVTSMGDYAFWGCEGLTSVTIGSGVTSIGDLVFENCYGLTSITIPNSVTSIGKRAFNYCSSLNSVNIPSSVTSIGNSAFGYCSSLSSITVASGNKSYDSRDNCNAIIETASNTLITGCNNTIIPCSVTIIGGGAFAGYSFTSITIPNNVTSIGIGAFAHCSGLTSITIPNSVTSIGGSAFYECSNLTSIAIPNSVTSIGEDTFFYCSSLASVTIPNSVTSIGKWAFVGCSSLTSVTIPSSVTSIGQQAFCDCYALTSVTIPSSVTSIGQQAFCNCYALTSVTNLAIVPQTIGSSTFSEYRTLHVRKGYKGVYAAKDYWKEFTIVDDAVASTTITDGEEYVSATATDYDEVAYTRTFNNTDWQALYVPFSLNYNEWKDYFDIAEISTYAQYDDNADGDYDRMNLVVEKLEAGSTLPNHPYLIRAKSTGTKTLALTNKTLEAAETNSITCSSALGNYELTITGTYTEKTDMFANAYYALSGGRLMQANSASVVLKPQRWYIDAKTLGSGVKAWKIVVEEAEGIKAPSSSPKGESPVAYDLMGRSVKAGAKGISIVNGKKIIN